ncbi:Protein kinase and PP2C-like domain-containing protein [Porphyridium purpureum]|uniref:Protein kinase and PP2C-like domain-containing protein n=1 Tax=Porphyridium purpureum TaxID=35688 RepID=A0A5J4Z6C0_PORPP|nr:Protein kinase and PP2C-like domain-containing protein [Porphyridium purpureum]|eukprot:POR4900..scf295_1
MGRERSGLGEGPTARAILFSDLRDLVPLATGGGASVFRCSMLDAAGSPQQVVARKARITSLDALERFEAELRLRLDKELLGRPHEGLLPLLAYCDTAPNYVLVSPYLPGGSLFDVLHKKGARFGFRRVLELAIQLASAVHHLHEHGLLHRDLKTANVLLDEHLQHAVLCDFDLMVERKQLVGGSSTGNGADASMSADNRMETTQYVGRADRQGPSAGRLKQMVGTLVYLAPEVLRGQVHDFAADIYSLGIVLNELASACVPYVDRQLPEPELHTVLETRFNQLQLRSAIVADGLRPVLAAHVPLQFSQLVELCWHRDASERPSAHNVLSELRELAARGDMYLADFSAAAGGEVDSVVPSSSVAHGRGALFARAIDERARLEMKRKLLAEQPYSDDRIPAHWKSEWKPDSGQLVSSLWAGQAATCGKRGEDRMEDRSLICCIEDKVRMFCVFDGHGGFEAAEFAALMMPAAYVCSAEHEGIDPESALVHAFERVDLALRCAHSPRTASGSTALSVVVMPSPSPAPECRTGERWLSLYFANAGDCRAVLALDSEEYRLLTRDHVAADQTEHDLVEARGGFFADNGRVNGKLVVTRALGDYEVKPAVSCTPEISVLHLVQESDSSVGDQLYVVDDSDSGSKKVAQFLILATDGIWDVMNEADAVRLVRSTARDPDMASKRLMMEALARGSSDNISVVVVFLSKQDRIVRL